MNPNFLVVALVALIPLIIGFIWYNPKTLGSAWMRSAGITEESMKGANMALIFGLTYVFSFMLSVAMIYLTIHQSHLFSLLADNPDANVAGTAVNDELRALIQTYGHKFRTYGHGAVHGIVSCLTIVFPVLAVNALFERKNWTYILINTGFWMICMIIMGAIICQHGVVYN